jgi:hypothetical protein
MSRISLVKPKLYGAGMVKQFQQRLLYEPLTIVHKIHRISLLLLLAHVFSNESFRY